MSKKWYSALLIAAILGLILAVTIKIAPGFMVPFSASKSSSTATISPAPISKEVSSDNTTTPIPEVQSLPLETTPPQEQGSTSLASREKPSSNTTTPIPEVQSLPLETTTPQDQGSTRQEQHLNATVQSPVTFSTFENSSYGVRIQYPSNWQILEETDDNDGIIEITRFVSPLEDRFDIYKERLWLSVDILPRNKMTLQEYSREVINHDNESLQDFELIDHDTDSTILAGGPAYRFIHTRSLDDGTSIKQMEIGTKIGNKVYYLTYSAEEEKYNAFLPVIQEMIDSFEIER